MTAPLRHTPLLPGNLMNLFYPPSQYIYFRDEKPAFVSTGVLGQAAWAADAAMLAYARYGQTRMTDRDLDECFGRAGLTYRKIGGTNADWNAPGTQALFASCDSFAFLAFRGTERDDPADLISDADLALTHEMDHRSAPGDPEPALGHLAFVSQLISGACCVHRGFQRALDQVWNDVHDLVSDYRRRHPHSEIVFTGHSLGAAIAVLAFSRFADPDLSLYTFGCPRVGDGAFRDRVLSNPARGIYRFVNFNDAVTHVPTSSLLYRQIPESCYRFSEDGQLDTDDGSFKGDVESLRGAIAGFPASIRTGDLNTIPAPPSLVDHSPARYCYRFWDCVA